MERSYKFRLYPRREEQRKLQRTLDTCRFLYNASLEERITAFKNGVAIRYIDQTKKLTQDKKTNDFYKVVHSQVLQGVLRKLDNSYRNFFRRCKAGGKPGFPRFKSDNRFHSFTYPQSGFEVLPSGHVILSKVGTVRMFKHRLIKGTIKTCNIKKDGMGHWYATFSVELPDIPKGECKTAVGVDLGLKHLATLSTGETIEPPRFLKHSQGTIKKRQRTVSRKKKGSNNRRKAIYKLAKAHLKVERQRDDFLHKQSRKLIEKADVVVFEDLDIQDMMKEHRLAGSISDASWGKLVQYTTYKAEEAGKLVVLVDPRGTSQICSRCGETVLKALSERFHFCPSCGFSVDRDFNAALNVLRRLPTDSGELIKTPVEATPLPSPIGGGKCGP